MPSIPVLTAELARAARALLRWSQQDLAEKAGVAVSTVADFEREDRTPVQNNAAAMRVALERAGIAFRDDGSIALAASLVFMTGERLSTLSVQYGPDSAQLLFDLLSLFGEGAAPSVAIDAVQCASPGLKDKVTRFVDLHGVKIPKLKQFKKMLCDLKDDEFFLLLPSVPESTEERVKWERVLHHLNSPQEPDFMAEQEDIFGRLLQEYNLVCPPTDRPTLLGDPRRKNRTCRFCGSSDPAKFKSDAHALPAAVGNQLKQADECDDCNGHFGRNVEPTLIEYLNIQRVFLGIEGRGGRPNPQYSGGGSIYNDGTGMVVVSSDIKDDASGGFKARLGTAKPVVAQKFYQALAKSALSVIPKEELPALEETIQWVRYGKRGTEPLPKIAAAIVNFPPSPSAQITLYIRKSEMSRLPHVIGEFRLGCFMYVFALPFSKKDEWDLIGFFDEKAFKDIFRHYTLGPAWTLQDYGSTKEVTPTYSIRMIPRNPKT